MVKVSVKWGKENYEVESVESLEEFQALLFSLTMVPPDRQKIMCKGKMIKDSAAVAALKEGDKLVLMGTADAPPKAPEKAVVFEEDLTDAQKVGVVKDLLSAGLHNLGNTCYMASTLQCMRAVPELKQALIAKSLGAQPAQHDPNHAVVRQLGSLYREMDRTTQAVTPMMFTTVFRSTFPQFAETNNEGNWMQQDAEEALIQLMNAMANVLKKEQIAAGGGLAGSNAENNVIDEYFGGKMETRTVLKPLPGSEDSAAAAAAGSSAAASSSSSSTDGKVEIESYRRLKCFIDIETNFLFQGIKASLSEELELRGQLYQRSSTLLTLPRYLIVQMMRFGWRKDTKLKTKILRKVDFPMRLDVAEFAHPALKHQLLAARNFIKDEQDEKLGLSSLTKKAKTAEGQTAGSSSAAMDVDAGAAASSASASASPSPPPASSSLTLSTPTSGNYEVIGMVTHKGRSSDSGHYVSWTKQSDGQWLKFDDDVVTRVSEDDVKLLSGGGDRDSTYLLFYKRIDDATKFIGQTIPEPTVAPVFDNAKKAAEKGAASSSAAPAAASK